MIALGSKVLYALADREKPRLPRGEDPANPSASALRRMAHQFIPPSDIEEINGRRKDWPAVAEPVEVGSVLVMIITRLSLVDGIVHADGNVMLHGLDVLNVTNRPIAATRRPGSFWEPMELPVPFSSIDVVKGSLFRDLITGLTYPCDIWDSNGIRLVIDGDPCRVPWAELVESWEVRYPGAGWGRACKLI